MVTSNFGISELSVMANSNGTFSIVSSNGGVLVYTQDVDQYKQGQREFTRYKANDILNHISDLAYRDIIALDKSL